MDNIKLLPRKDGTKLVISATQMIYGIVGAMVAIFLLGSGAVLFINEITVAPKAMAALEKTVDESEARGRRDLEAAEKRWLERHTESLESQEKIRQEFTNVVTGLRGELRARDLRVDDKFDRIMSRLPRHLGGL